MTDVLEDKKPSKAPIHPAIREDLKKSGLHPNTFEVRGITPSEASMLRLPGGFAKSDDNFCAGYIIPYRDIRGRVTPFYRARLFEGDLKYLQPTGSSSHVYFPAGFLPLARQNEVVLIVEGEKKAACACQNGFAAVGLGGVHNWRNRTLTLPNGSELKPVTRSGNTITVVKLPPELPYSIMDDTSALATGLSDLIDLGIHFRWRFVIVFDRDTKLRTANDVQTAAARLGHELRYRGIASEHITQAKLPLPDNLDPTLAATEGFKIGLDDYIVESGAEAFEELLDEHLQSTNNLFPQHPNIRHLITRRLEAPRLSRKQIAELALSIVLDMDTRGKRVLSQDGSLHYFDSRTNILIPAQLLRRGDLPMHETPLGVYLYQNYGLTAGDARILQWVGSTLTGDGHIEQTSTHKVLALPKTLPDSIAVQLSDTHYALVSPNKDKPVSIRMNGELGILFEANQVEPVNMRTLQRHIQEMQRKPLVPLWMHVLETMKFQNDEMRKLAAVLFYLSPWLHRWRGSQLPIELAIGEAGSGKSTLYGLRQMVITGRQRLVNMPTDMKGWYAGITNTGGLYVIDNVHFTGGHRDLRQQLSDEMCRLVTEPNPHIELRQLFTTSDVTRIPADVCFAITSIEPAFQNTDLLQRSVVFELSAIGGGHVANWTQRMLAHAGGREGWLAHQMLVLHKFLHLATQAKLWDNDYQASHRLANYEQLVGLMHRVLDLDSYSQTAPANGYEGRGFYDTAESQQGDSWARKLLTSQLNTQLTESDWVIQGLRGFLQEFVQGRLSVCNSELGNRNAPDIYSRRWMASHVVEWAEMEEDFKRHPILTNARRLGRYMKSQASVLQRTLGIETGNKYMNRETYKIIDGHDVSTY